MTDAELTKLYNEANGIGNGKNPPITTQRIFTAMRAAFNAGRASLPVKVPDGMVLLPEYVTTFQTRVHWFMQECFGDEAALIISERTHRFLEEAIELSQACGCTAAEAHQLVDYVFARPVGEAPQEVGGTMTTLAALCTALDVNMTESAEVELARVWKIIDKIKAKAASKPKNSPLPGTYPPDECGNCFDGKSDMDHVCRKCGGARHLAAAPKEGRG